MSSEEQSDSGDETDEELVMELLRENPFYDDRVDTLVNCLVMELQDIGLAEDKLEEAFREIRAAVDKYELTVPDRTRDVN